MGGRQEALARGAGAAEARLGSESSQPVLPPGPGPELRLRCCFESVRAPGSRGVLALGVTGVKLGGPRSDLALDTVGASSLGAPQVFFPADYLRTRVASATRETSHLLNILLPIVSPGCHGISFGA